MLYEKFVWVESRVKGEEDACYVDGGNLILRAVVLFVENIACIRRWKNESPALAKYGVCIFLYRV